MRNTIGAALMVACTTLFAGEVSTREKTIEERVTKALELAAEHLQPWTAMACTTMEYVHPAEGLRRAARETEEREADIATIRTALKAWKAHQAAEQSKTNMTFETDTTSDHVDPQFKAGFAAGVKWGIVSFMQNPEEGDVDFHIHEAQKWHWLVVVDHGKSLIDAACAEAP